MNGENLRIYVGTMLVFDAMSRGVESDSLVLSGKLKIHMLLRFVIRPSLSGNEVRLAMHHLSC
jgi:hypothetical protein